MSASSITGAADVKRVARGGGVLLVATLVGNTLLLLLDVYLNALLGRRDYGVYVTWRRALAFAGFVGALGMENTVIRGVAGAGTDLVAARGTVRVAAVATAATSLCVGLLFFSGRGLFVGGLHEVPAAAWVALIGAATLPLAALRLIGVSASQGAGRVSHRALVMFLAWPVVQFALLPVFIRLVPAGEGLLAAALAYGGSMVLGAVLAALLLFRVRRDMFLLAAPGRAALLPLLAYSAPLWAQGIVMAAYTWADQLVLAGIGGAEAAGVYGPVAALAPLFGVGLTALNGIFAPMIAEKHARGEHEALGRLYRTVTRWAVAVALPPLVVSMVAPEAVLALWPHGAPEAATALRITCVAQLGCTLVGSVNYLLIMAGYPRATLWNGLPAVALNLVLSVLLVPWLGVTGAALANAAAMLTANGLGLYQVWGALRLHPFAPALAKPFLAAIPAAGLVWGVAQTAWSPLVVVVSGGIGGGLLLLGGLGLLGLDADDRVIVDGVLRKLGRRS